MDALAPHAAIRAQVVPQTVPEQPPVASPKNKNTSPPPKRSTRWAELLARVFGFDLQACPQCGGAWKIIAAILEPHAIHAILTHLRLPDKPPGLAPARFPTQPDFA